MEEICHSFQKQGARRLISRRGPLKNSERTVFRINAPRVVHQTVDGETIVIDFESGTYYSINKVGAIIWDHVAKGSTINEIVQVLGRQYRGVLPDIENAVANFLAEIQRESLISPIDIEGQPQSTYLTSNPTIEHTATDSVFELPVLCKYTDMQDLLLLDPIHDVDERGWPIKKDRMEG